MWMLKNVTPSKPMKMKFIKRFLLLILAVVIVSCVGEAKQKLKQVKSVIGNTSVAVKEAKKVESPIDRLKNEVPLSNDELKSWLPNQLDGMKRTSFKIGQAGMYKVNSVEGVYKDEAGKRSVSINVIDGAGPTGSMMAAGFGFVGEMDMEEEDELKHRKTTEVNGVRAQQTYYKKDNRTHLLFSFEERFLVTLTAHDMNEEETWAVVEEFKLNKLKELTKNN